MRIRYIFPGVISKTELGGKELLRRQARLREWAFAGTAVDVVALDAGPATIESVYEKYLSVPASVRIVLEAQSAGYDAAIIGCFGDAGLDALREVSDMLVVGPASASIAAATTLCRRFSIVTVVPGLVADMWRLAWEVGAVDKLASVTAVDLPVITLNTDPNSAAEKLFEVCSRAVQKDGAEVVILGCMSMGFMDATEQMSSRLGVPVINPAKAGLKMAEALAAQGLRHSRRAYPTPKKVEMGSTVDELFLR